MDSLDDSFNTSFSLSSSDMSINDQLLSASPRQIWFQLLDRATGQSYKESSVDKVSVSLSSDVADFRDAVKAKNPILLASVDAAQLIVYKNKNAFDDQKSDNEIEEPLKPHLLIHGNGESVDEALIVVVPSLSVRFSPIAHKSNLPIKEPYVERKRRWLKLNKTFEQRLELLSATYSVEDLNMTWDEVESIYTRISYVQPLCYMDGESFDRILKYLSSFIKTEEELFFIDDSEHLEFIAPILQYVCTKFNGEVKLLFQQDLVGKRMNIRCRFDFMVIRGKKAICIMQSKNKMVDNGVVPALVGCEVAADVYDLDTIYGIVTDCKEWTYFCRHDDKVRIDKQTLSTNEDIFDRRTLGAIVGKICAVIGEE